MSWEFDDVGRPIRARATIREVFGGERSRTEASLTGVIGNEGPATDIGGHLIGWRFLGEDSGRFNIVQMNGKLDGGDLPSNLNTGAYQKLENEIADWADLGMEATLPSSTVERPSV